MFFRCAMERGLSGTGELFREGTKNELWILVLNMNMLQNLIVYFYCCMKTCMICP
jgi:hypothetical protein